MINTNCRPEVNSRVIIRSSNNASLNSENIFTSSNKKTGKKRLFNEMQNFPDSDKYSCWEDSQTKIDKTILNLSTLSITKKFKVNSLNKTTSHIHKIPTEKYFTTIDEKNIKTDTKEEIVERTQSDLEPCLFNMEREKEMVESYYREKNKFLMLQMFGNNAL
jgi:hypothetical protein